MHSANFSDDLEKLLQRHNLSVRDAVVVDCAEKHPHVHACWLLTNLHPGSCAGPSSSRYWQRSAGQSCRAERRGSGCGGCSKRRIDVQRIAQGARNFSGDRQTQRAARRKSIQVSNAQDASVHTGRNQGGSCLSHRCDVCIVVAIHAS
jgi:hypothetical protein